MSLILIGVAILTGLSQNRVALYLLAFVSALLTLAGIAGLVFRA
jgi:hypothetical protein